MGISNKLRGMRCGPSPSVVLMSLLLSGLYICFGHQYSRSGILEMYVECPIFFTGSRMGLCYRPFTSPLLIDSLSKTSMYLSGLSSYPPVSYLLLPVIAPSRLMF